MKAIGSGSKVWLLSTALVIGCPVAAFSANADTVKQRHVNVQHRSVANHSHVTSSSAKVALNAKHTYRYQGISCVPYARQVTGMQIAGNAWQWWDNAAGTYARGNRPETGAVLNFRANGRMHLGHVAVVSRVVNEREVIIDQANWPTGGGYGGISHDVAVVDVSEANDWSAVRVELGRGGTFGSVYPTYGFIYNRPDTGMVTASVSRPAPMPEINSAPSDLRPKAERPWRTVEEVAEAPGTVRRIDLRFSNVSASWR